MAKGEFLFPKSQYVLARLRLHLDGGDSLTIDVDSSICETYGLKKQGGSRFTHTHVRGYHPLVAVASPSGEVLHARLRGGPANTGREPATS